MQVCLLQPPAWLLASSARAFSTAQTRAFSTSQGPLEARRWADKSLPAYTGRFRNPVREVAGMKAPSPDKTESMYDNKPFKVRVEKYMRYQWCGCGLARTQQPFCDFTCQNINFKRLVKTGPVEYIAPETKDVWFCNCKQTDNRPFCDGSHRSEEVQNHRFDSKPLFWEPRSKKHAKKEE